MGFRDPVYLKTFYSLLPVTKTGRCKSGIFACNGIEVLISIVFGANITNNSVALWLAVKPAV